MKVVKPLKVPILTRVFEHKRQPRLHVAAVLAFPLATPRALLDELAFWDAVGPALGASVLDECITKAKAEVLVAGRWFAPGGKAVPVSFVRVQVGALDKRLAVLGDRHWRHDGPSEPRPMTEMPIDWAHAFGGPSYALNPYGIGVEAVERDGQSVVPLPNVEHFGAPIVAASDRPEPAGLSPMDMSFEQRRARAGTFGTDYAEKHAPGLPPDHHPTVFNLGPADQWLGAPWRGDERIVIENMSPTSPRIESALPGLVARAFVTQRSAEGPRFVEVPLRCDTVWLLPGAGLAAVVFHGSLAVADDDAADLAHLVVACEDPATPRPVEHYRAALDRRLDKDKGAIADLSDSDLMPPRESGVAANMDMGPLGQWVQSEMIGMANAHRGAERLRKQRRDEVVAEGIDPGPLGLDTPLPPPAPPPPTQDLDALAKFVVDLEAQIAEEESKVKGRDEQLAAVRRELREELGQDPDDLDEEPPAGGPPTFRAREQLALLAEIAESSRARGAPNMELEARLANPAFPGELERLERMTQDTYIQSAHLMPAAAPMPEATAQLARVVVQAARDGGMSLAERDFTGADLRGADLSGMDFSRAFLEGADLRDADLRGAQLGEIVLARADLRGAKLDDANLAGANLGRANLEGASLVGADLTRVVMTGAALRGASFSRAKIVGADLLEVSWRGVDLSAATLERCSFIKSDLTGVNLSRANLEQATFVECVLDDADFTEANLFKSTFVTCRGERVRFVRARLTEAVISHQNELPHADLTDAHAERSCLRTTRFTHARFARAHMSQADLSECDASHGVFDQAVLDHALLIRAQLKSASLRGVDLTEAILSKSRIDGADFTGAQLTRADLTRARGDDKSRFTEAVVRFTRFDRHVSGGGASS